MEHADDGQAQVALEAHSTALQVRPARSEPAPGSLKSRHHAFDRAFVVLHRGFGGMSRRRSTTIDGTPSRARSIASVVPTGPAPTMRTAVSSASVMASPDRGAGPRGGPAVVWHGPLTAISL